MWCIFTIKVGNLAGIFITSYLTLPLLGFTFQNCARPCAFITKMSTLTNLFNLLKFLVSIHFLVVVEGQERTRVHLQELWDVASSIQNHGLTVDNRILILGVCGSGKSSVGKALMGPNEPDICSETMTWISKTLSNKFDCLTSNDVLLS